MEVGFQAINFPLPASNFNLINLPEHKRQNLPTNDLPIISLKKQWQSVV
jgi:hypothetical protein